MSRGLQGLRACSYSPCALIIRSYLFVVMEHIDLEIKIITSELRKSVYSENKNL